MFPNPLAPQLGRLSHVSSFPRDWCRWAVLSHGCAKRTDGHVPDCRCGSSPVPFRFTPQCAVEYKSPAIMVPGGEL